MHSLSLLLFFWQVMQPIAMLIDTFQADGGPNTTMDLRNMGAGFIIPRLTDALRILSQYCEANKEDCPSSSDNLPDDLKTHYEKQAKEKKYNLIWCRPLAIVLFNSLHFR